MEAMDLLLMACHAQTLNLFVESFLRMVQKLLEDTNPNLQILATNSVGKWQGTVTGDCDYVVEICFSFIFIFIS